jgi:hypothetical protein
MAGGGVEISVRDLLLYAIQQQLAAYTAYTAHATADDGATGGAAAAAPSRDLQRENTARTLVQGNQ